jgi:hypothetical protein
VLFGNPFNYKIGEEESNKTSNNDNLLSEQRFDPTKQNFSCLKVKKNHKKTNENDDNNNYSENIQRNKIIHEKKEIHNNISNISDKRSFNFYFFNKCFLFLRTYINKQ